MQPLAEAGYYVISVDMPGWGKSQSWVDGPLSNGMAEEAVLAILDGLNRDSAILMGKSWGGGIALELAVDFPLRVSELVLTAPAFRELPRLQTLSQPVLLAWAKDDPVIPVLYAAEFENAIPDIEVIIYDQGGHSAAARNAPDFSQQAIRFLKEQDRESDE
jgi:pimeloyl-ACP methyl ester carboxylesterase